MTADGRYHLHGLDIAAPLALDVEAVAGGRAIAIAGQSGAGKSTFVAACCAGGAELLSDDTLRLATRADAVLGHRGGGEIRLRASALERTGAWPGPVARTTADGRSAVR